MPQMGESRECRNTERYRSRGQKNGGHSRSPTQDDKESKVEKGDQLPRRFAYKRKSSQSVRIGSRCIGINPDVVIFIIITLGLWTLANRFG